LQKQRGAAELPFLSSAAPPEGFEISTIRPVFGDDKFDIMSSSYET
jgi:hypothetical protein